MQQAKLSEIITTTIKKYTIWFKPYQILQAWSIPKIFYCSVGIFSYAVDFKILFLARRYRKLSFLLTFWCRKDSSWEAFPLGTYRRNIQGCEKWTKLQLIVNMTPARWYSNTKGEDNSGNKWNSSDIEQTLLLTLDYYKRFY